MEEVKKKKLIKIANIVINVLVVVILALALALTVFNLYSKNNKKGYTNIAGKSYLTVESTSMAADLEDGGTYTFKKNNGEEVEAKVTVGSFGVGDMLRIKLLKGDEKKNLKIGDIITFVIPSKTDVPALDSHRIVDVVEVDSDGDGVREDIRYYTKGDNERSIDINYSVLVSKTTGVGSIVGVVEKNVGGIGKVFRFFRSSTGFLCLVVVPSFLIVIYFAFNLVREIMKRQKANLANTKDQMREELMAELLAQNSAAADVQAQPADEVKQEGQTAPEEAKQAESEQAESAPAEEQKEEVKAEEAAPEVKEAEPEVKEAAQKPKTSTQKPKTTAAQKPKTSTQKPKTTATQKPKTSTQKTNTSAKKK